MTQSEKYTDFLEELEYRGLLYQCSNLEKLKTTMSEKPIKAYIGFDCTADSLHVGSLIPIMLLRLLQKYGHTPVVLLGEATSLIGDPSGKDKTRKMLSPEDVHKNKEGIKKVIGKFLNIDNVLFVNNSDWLSDFNYMNFLRKFGPLFTINRMLSFDSVKSRLEREQPLSFLEFNYMLLQAVDFLHLYKNEDVCLQLGGSDQWGNIISGIELVRKYSGAEVFGITSPLITNADGSKMGKTEKGAVWLSEDKIEPWDYYQFWRNVADDNTLKFLKLFTDLPFDTIQKLSSLKGSEINAAKKILAFETTKLCFGEKLAKKVEETAKELFENNITAEGLPTIIIPPIPDKNTILLLDILLETQLISSKNQGRQLISNSGLKINDKLIINPNHTISATDFDENNKIKVSFGKKRHFLLSIAN